LHAIVDDGSVVVRVSACGWQRALDRVGHCARSRAETERRVQPQPLENRVERLEQRVTVLEQLPERVDKLALEISQFRDEMRAEFSAVRTELQTEMRAGDEETRRVLRVIGDEIMSQAKPCTRTCRPSSR
jgi:hypothetical protein